MADIKFLSGRAEYWAFHPRLAFDSITARMYYYGNPEYPWITRECIEILERIDMTGWHFFEWGAGRSTVYFA